ncbi:MAG: precorrin-3B C(17)-methyltransferase [Ahrensia sp.]|nr:precorrin-3B C(17)-methyltransferase [Ahrensia sp.]
MKRQPAIVVLNQSALPIAAQIAALLGGVIHALDKRVDAPDHVAIKDLRSHLQALFLDGTPIVALMASGALIRLLAPVLSDKMSEPPVICVSEDGAHVVPLLGGHHGANDMARDIAKMLGSVAAVTTAGDVKFGVALDAPPAGYVLANPSDAKNVMAEIVSNRGVHLIGDADWLRESKLPLVATGENRVRLTITDHAAEPRDLELVYHPKTLVVGVGCERDCPADDLIGLVTAQLAAANLSPHSVACVTSIDVKADEAAVHAVAEYFGAPARFFDAAALEAQTPRLQNPSDVVFAEVGCHGVAEGAALAAVGPNGALIVPKAKTKRATCAIARAPQPIVDLPGRARGTVFVVGIGPGSEGWRSPEVSRMILQSSDLVGYSLYLDLLGSLGSGKQRHDFQLGKEEDRVRHAMELAGQGKTVSLVCSGDAGIYAMATLIYELFDKGGISDAARRVEVINSPGISALQGAAARAGAPLGHDFCTISLSDLLTPWADIQRRVRAAGDGDFVIAFYNPVSMKRRTQLAWARDELLNHRPASSPVVLATNLGRVGEKVRIVPLGELNVDDVDMLTVVVVGSSDSRSVTTGDGRTWVYTPRGYSGKESSEMKR